MDVDTHARRRHGRRRRRLCAEVPHIVRIYWLVIALHSEASSQTLPNSQAPTLRPRDTAVLLAGEWTLELELELARDPPHYDAGDETVDFRRGGRQRRGHARRGVRRGTRAPL